MVREAEQHRAEDQRRKERVEARNQADNLVYQADKLLREQGDKIPANVKSTLESQANALRNVLDTADTPELRRRTQELAQTLQQAGAAMYGQAGPTTPPGGERGPGGDEDIVEGEYKEA